MPDARLLLRSKGGGKTQIYVEEQDEIPGHSVGGLDVKMEVGRNLGLRKSKQDYKKEGRRERKFKRKFFFPYASV